MPFSVEPHIVNEYSIMVDHEFQQKLSRTRKYVRVETGVVGHLKQFPLVAPTRMQDVTGQINTATVWQDVQSKARWAPRKRFLHAVLLGLEETQETIVALGSAYVQNGVMAKNVEVDAVILEGILAIAQEGRDGVDTSAYDLTAPALDGTGTGGEIPANATGMTLDKLEEMRNVFSAREVGLDDIEAGRTDAFVCVMTPQQMRNLMTETKATSSDFINDLGIRAPLVGGYIPMLHGFELRQSNLLSKNAGGERQVLSWHSNAVGLAVWLEEMTTIDRLPTLMNAMGIQLQASMGAVRIQDKGVLSTACVEV